MTYTDVGDLEVVEDDGVALRAGAKVERREVLGETELGRPARVGVRERKDLWRVVGKQLRMVMEPTGERRTLSLRPRKRAQPLRTKASLAATTATTSTPFALNSSYLARYGGRWFAWQVGYRHGRGWEGRSEPGEGGGD